MKYMSDRVPLILASNGTMISDCDYSGIFEPNHDYIYVKSVPDAIQKIKWLLSELLYLLVGIDFNAH